MAVIGSATVVIRAVTNKIESDIEKGLGPATRNAGKSAGKDLGSSIQEGLKNVELSPGLIETSKASKSASDKIHRDISSALGKPTTIAELNIKSDAASKRAADKLIADVRKNIKTSGLKLPAPKPQDLLADWNPKEVSEHFVDTFRRELSAGKFSLPEPDMSDFDRVSKRVTEDLKISWTTEPLPAPDTSEVDKAINNTKRRYERSGPVIKVPTPDMTEVDNSVDRTEKRFLRLGNQKLKGPVFERDDLSAFNLANFDTLEDQLDSIWRRIDTVRSRELPAPDMSSIDKAINTTETKYARLGKQKIKPPVIDTNTSSSNIDDLQARILALRSTLSDFKDGKFVLPNPDVSSVKRALNKTENDFKNVKTRIKVDSPDMSALTASLSRMQDMNNIDWKVDVDIDSINTAKNAFSRLRYDVDKDGNAITRNNDSVAKRFASSWSAAGKNASSNLIANFGNSQISSHLKRMFYMMLFGAPIVGALIGAIGALASGLFALGAAVGPAVNSLAILPGILGAVVAGVGATVLAFGGIGTAFSAGNKAITGTGSAARTAGAAAARAANTTADAYETAAEKIADAYETAAEKTVAANEAMATAQERLSDVIYNNAKSMVSAQRSVRDSQETLTTTQARALRAQLSITQAREDALDSIKELQFSVEGAAIAEGRAVIALERAREKLAEVNELPVNHRLRREAQLNYDAAELDLRRAIKSNEDLAKEQADSAKKGVEGSDIVVDAIQDEIDAQRDLRDAKEAAADAAQSYTENELSSARDLRDARKSIVDINQDLIDIEEDLAKAIARANDDLAKSLRDVAISAGGSSGAASGIDAFADAMKKLSPEARSFVTYMLSVKDTFKAVRDEAGRDLFPKLETGIQRLINGGFLDLLGGALRESGSAIGDLAIDIANLSSDEFFQGQFSSFMSSNVTVLDTFNESVLNLITWFTNLGVAAAPVTEEFARWISTITGNWAKTSTDDMQGLSDKIQRGAEVAKQLGDIFGTLWGVIKNVGEAARTSGEGLLTSFEDSLVKLEALTASPNTELSDYFAGVAENVRALGDMLNTAAMVILSMGDNPSIGQVADVITTRVLPALETMLTLVTDEMGVEMSELFASLVEVFAVVASGGGLEAFVSVLQAAADALTGLSNIPGFSSLIGYLAAFFGLWKGASFVASLIPFFGTMKVKLLELLVPIIASTKQLALNSAAWLWNTTKMVASTVAMKASAVAQKALEVTQRGLNAAMSANPMGIIIAAIMVLVATFMYAWNNIDGFKEFFINMWGYIKSGFETALKWLSGAGEAIAAPFIWVVDFIKDLFGIHSPSTFMADIGKFLVEGLVNGLKGLWNAITSVWDGVVDFISGVWDKVWEVISGVLDTIKDLFFKFHPIGIIIKNWDAIASFFTDLWDKVWDIISGVLDTIKDLFFKFHPLGIIIKNWDAIASFFTDLWNGILDIVKSVISTIISTLTDWVSFIVSIPGKIGTGLANMWDALSNGIQAAIDFVVLVIDGIIEFVLALPGTFLAGLATIWDAIWTTLEAAIQFTKDYLGGMIDFVISLPGKVIDGLKTIWDAIWNTISAAIQLAKNFLSDMITWVSGLPGKVLSAVTGLWGAISDGAVAAKDWAILKFDELLTWVGGLGASISTKASGMWDGISSAFKSALNWIIDKWNSLSFSMPSFEAFGKTVGGFTITVPQIPRFADGGVVSPSPGGTLGLIAEAGKSERITPLDSDGFSAGERRMIEALESGRGGGAVINIYSQPGQDVQLLAKLVSRELAFNG